MGTNMVRYKILAIATVVIIHYRLNLAEVFLAFVATFLVSCSRAC